MNPINEIKRWVLKTLLAAQGTPMSGEWIDGAVLGFIRPRPLLSDVHQAKRDLEEGGFIIGTKDDLDGSVSWGLTAKGELKAKQL